MDKMIESEKEFEEEEEEIKKEKEKIREMSEKMKLLRRDIEKMIELDIIEGMEGNWENIKKSFRDIVEEIKRREEVKEMEMMVEKMREIRENVDKMLKKKKKDENLRGNEYKNERKINE